MQKTSLEAYKILEPELGTMQYMVFNCINAYPDGVSNIDLCRMLKRPINTITPRVKELRDKGIVIYIHTKVDHITHRRVMCWKTVC